MYTEVRHRVLKLVILTAFTRSSRSIPSPHQNTVSALVHPRLYLDKVHTLVCHVPSRRRSAAPASDNLLIKTNQNNYMAAKSLGESLGRVLQDFRTPYPGSIARFPLAFAQSRSICPGNFGPICFHHHPSYACSPSVCSWHSNFRRSHILNSVRKNFINARADDEPSGRICLIVKFCN